jgi:hypothetical protein
MAALAAQRSDAGNLDAREGPSTQSLSASRQASPSAPLRPFLAQPASTLTLTLSSARQWPPLTTPGTFFVVFAPPLTMLALLLVVVLRDLWLNRREWADRRAKCWGCCGLTFARW